MIEHLEMAHHPSAFDGSEIFQGPVRNVLEHRCIHCHNNQIKNGELNLQDRNLVLQGGPEARPFIVPGKPDQSLIWHALLRPDDHPQLMPADGWGLTLYEMQSFRAWIEDGAYWPEGEAGKLEIKPFTPTASKPL